MFKKIKSKLNLNDDEKKKLTILIVTGIFCLITIFGINFYQLKNEDNEDEDLSQVAQNTNLQEQTASNKNLDLESRLTDILKEIKGAGDVSVMITYDSSEELQPAYNSSTTKETTSETDSSGGERTVETSSENKTMVTSSSSEPIVIKTQEAKIKGVIVVASGANDPTVKETLYEAVQTALQISGYQVQIYAK